MNWLRSISLCMASMTVVLTTATFTVATKVQSFTSTHTPKMTHTWASQANSGQDVLATSAAPSDTDTDHNWTAISTYQPPTNVPQPIVSKEVYDRMMSILDTFILCFELLSILLTSTSAYIYALPDMRCPTACYLVSLSIADTVSGAIVVVRTAWNTADQAGAASKATFHYLTMWGSLFITISCRRLVYCLSVLLDAERFFAITFPLRALHRKMIRFPKLCVLALVLTVQTYHIYLPLKYQVTLSSRGQGYVMTFSDLFREHEQVFDDVSNAGKILFSYIPLSLCLVLSVALKVALQRHQTSRKSLQQCQPQDPSALRACHAEKQLATTIWLSTLLFALLSLPANTVQIVSSYHPTFCFLGLEHRLYRLVGRLAYVAIVASRYTSFFTYLSLSTAFRRHLLRLLRVQKVVRVLEEKKGKKKEKKDLERSSCVGHGCSSSESSSSATLVSVVSLTDPRKE